MLPLLSARSWMERVNVAKMMSPDLSAGFSARCTVICKHRDSNFAMKRSCKSAAFRLRNQKLKGGPWRAAASFTFDNDASAEGL